MDWRFNIMLFVLGISAWAHAEIDTLWHDTVTDCIEKGKRLPTLSDIDQLKEDHRDLDLVWTAHYITDEFESRDNIDNRGIQKCGYFTKTHLDSNEPDKVGFFSDCNERRNYYAQRNKDTEYYLSEEKKNWWDVYNNDGPADVWNGKGGIKLSGHIKDNTTVWIPTVWRKVQVTQGEHTYLKKENGPDELLNKADKCGFIDISSRNLSFTNCNNITVTSHCVEIIDTSTLPITSAYTTNYPTTSTERPKSNTSYITTERKNDLRVTATQKESRRQHKKEPKGRVLLIATLSAVILLIVIIAALATIWYCRRRSRRKKRNSPERAEENDDDNSAHYAVVSEVDNVENNYRQPADAIARPEILKHNYSDPYDSKIKKTTDDAAKIDVTDTAAIDSENDAANSPVHAYNMVTVKPGNYGNAYDHVTMMPKKSETFNTYDTCNLSNKAECSHSTSSAKKVTATVHHEARDSIYNHLIGT